MADRSKSGNISGPAVKRYEKTQKFVAGGASILLLGISLLCGFAGYWIVAVHLLWLVLR